MGNERTKGDGEAVIQHCMAIESGNADGVLRDDIISDFTCISYLHLGYHERSHATTLVSAFSRWWAQTV